MFPFCAEMTGLPQQGKALPVSFSLHADEGKELHPSSLPAAARQVTTARNKGASRSDSSFLHGDLHLSQAEGTETADRDRVAGRDVMVSRPCSSTLLWACQGQLGPETSGMNPSCSPIRAGRQDNPRNAHLPPTNIRGGPKAASDMDASPARNITAEVSSASATDRSSSTNIRVGIQTTLHVSPSFNKDLGHSCQIQIPGP